MVRVVEVAQLSSAYRDYVDAEVDGIVWEPSLGYRPNPIEYLWPLDQPTEIEPVSGGTPLKRST